MKADIGISFRFFGSEFLLSWKELSTVLGFHHKCSVDIEHVTRGYHKESFWHTISGLNAYTQPSCTDIQHPTLRLMHKWLALTCFSRVDIRTIRVDELRILYAMVNKIKIAFVFTNGLEIFEWSDLLSAPLWSLELP